MMKTILGNDGIQTAILAILLGVALTAFGEIALGGLLTSVGATYIIGKLQKRPVTVEAEREADADYNIDPELTR